MPVAARVIEMAGGCSVKENHHDRAILAVSLVLSSRQTRRGDLSVLRSERQRAERPDANNRRPPVTLALYSQRGRWALRLRAQIVAPLPP